MNPYLTAVIATGVAVLVRLLLEPVLAGQAPMLVFVAAVLVAAHQGGLKPGLLATGLSAVAGGTLFIGTRAFWPVNAAGSLRMFLFVLTGVLISFVTERLRRAVSRQILAEDKLRRYQLLADNSQDIMLFVDSGSGRILEANTAATAAYGYTRDEMLALTIYDLRSDATRGLTVHQMAAADRGGVQFEAEHRRKDGSLFPVEVRSHGATMDGRRVLLSVVRDITHRREAEEALRESEERFAKAFATNPTGIALTSLAEGRVIDVNATWQAMFGHNRDEVIGRSMLDVGIWASADDRDRTIAALLEAGSLVNRELSLRRRSGETVVCLASAAIVQVAGEEVVLSAWLDITERQRAEDALRRSEAKLRAVFHSLAEDVVLFDTEGRVDEANVSGLRLHGHTLEDVADPVRDPRARIVRRDGTPFPVEEQPAALALRTGRPVRDVEMGVASADGRVVWRLVNAQPVHDDAGRLLGAVASSFDITDRRRAEDALREADRRKDEFIAVLSHELRNPLAPIRYALPVLQREPLSETAARAFTVIDRQVEHLARLVDDLLDVSRIDRDKIELRPEKVSLATVVSAAADASSPAVQAARHTLRLEIPEEPVWVNADPARLSQVVTNLLNNSARYTPRGGTIVVEARKEDGQAVIRVRDNGIGIPPDALPAIFEMFRQVSRTDTSPGGLGIGLALVKRLVAMHGGTIEAFSEGVGRGAEFAVRLPLAEDAMAEEPATAPSQHRSGQPLRVLVVDDNPDLVEMLALLVESAGHEVRKALDGRAAVLAATAYRPDVVLLDLGLPVMSGLEVARELRRRPETASARIVALTGWGQEEDRRETERAGFDRHLTKPADPETLHLLLHEYGRRERTA